MQQCAGGIDFCTERTHIGVLELDPHPAFIRCSNIRWVRRIELGRVQGVEQQKEHISSSCEFRLTPKGRSFALIR